MCRTITSSRRFGEIKNTERPFLVFCTTSFHPHLMSCGPVRILCVYFARSMVTPVELSYLEVKVLWTANATSTKDIMYMERFVNHDVVIKG